MSQAPLVLQPLAQLQVAAASALVGIVPAASAPPSRLRATATSVSIAR